MKGSYKIRIKNQFVRYEFEIKRNITIIQGNSATGKTTLVEMIRDFYENGVSSGVELSCEKICTVLGGVDWQILLGSMKDRIIFIDEGNRFVLSDAFAKAVKASDNYYVIITREGLENLPYSVEEIYGIREAGKYAELKSVYNEFYHIYRQQFSNERVCFDNMIVEDSNSGYEFFSAISSANRWNVISAGGKSNIFKLLKESSSRNRILVVADGAAFGAEMNRIMKLVNENTHISLYLPESFEWLILKSGILRNNEIEAMLENPSAYIESEEYMSWEQYFTFVLSEKTKDTFFHYRKSRLNPYYLQKNIRTRIIGVIEQIELSQE